MAPPIVFPAENARRENVWLRMLMMGPTGAGKTKGALEIATNLFGGDLQVAGADTEHERMKLYADEYPFRHIVLRDDYSPERFIEVIDVVEREMRGGVLIFDSLSHEWDGPGGVLQLVDKFGEWKTVRPRHSKMIERMMEAELHLIVCVRSKMKYEVSEEAVPGRDKPRQVITKLGLGPVQDERIIYEFDIVADIDARSHEATFSNRCSPLVDSVRTLIPGKEVADIITGWLSEGDPPTPPPEATEDAVADLVAALREDGRTDDQIQRGLNAGRAENRGRLHPDWVAEQHAKALQRIAERAAAAPPPVAPEPEAEPEAAAEPEGASVE